MHGDSIVSPGLSTFPFAIMRLSASQFIFYSTLIVACGSAFAGSIAKRDADDGTALSRFYDDLTSMTRSIPIFGGLIAGYLDYVKEVYDLFEEMTNDAIARTIGGALPCTISLDGTECTGLEKNGGVLELFKNVINKTPELILPGLLKPVIIGAVDILFIPLIDIIFGGVIVES